MRGPGDLINGTNHPLRLGYLLPVMDLEGTIAASEIKFRTQARLTRTRGRRKLGSP